ncbi:MAG: hypothetical protein Q8M33_01155, partial [Hydrogenophaga sp.]|nr:hypothetical protein [Hydrogenophaga sp.]
MGAVQPVFTCHQAPRLGRFLQWVASDRKALPSPVPAGPVSNHPQALVPTMQFIRFSDLCANGQATGKRVFIRADLN